MKTEFSTFWSELLSVVGRVHVCNCTGNMDDRKKAPVDLIKIYDEKKNPNTNKTFVRKYWTFDIDCAWVAFYR